MYPNIGNNTLTKFENPILATIILVKHIKKAISLYFFLPLLTLFKNPEPIEIAVVKIAIKIISPYILLIFGNLLFITYTTGISKLEKLVFTFINNKKMKIDIAEIIIELNKEIIINCFRLFK